MKINHLNELIRVLKAIPEVDFDITMWKATVDDPEADNIPKLQDEHNCRAVACALGWAAQDSYFNNLGLKLDPDSDLPMITVPIFDLNGPVKRQEIYGYTAAAEFFGINISTAEILFSPDRYDTDQDTTPDQVIARVEFLIEHGQAKLWNNIKEKEFKFFSL